ncbi:hypothetical protein EJ02DRAFT_417659 [Clathrospora elynae]|uniref:Uncharacterized protein n=1 Tax=Clathrospora elynae TaxID=706981 RepID=A0A6A5T5N9_9PLEO|nr:hypothetical protein EJ02DRAFT_417659 [Clathrospora elynae]
MATRSLNMKDINQIHLMVIFVPCNMLLQFLNLWLWNRTQAQLRFSRTARTLASCVGVNMWAVGCVSAFFQLNKTISIVGWWFIGDNTSCE